MRKQNKRALYESIMKDVAKVVKKRLNESEIDNDDIVIHGKIVKRGNRYNVKLDNGQIVSDEWFDDITRIFKNYFLVEIGGELNVMNSDGLMLFDEWFDNIEINNKENGSVVLYKNNKRKFANIFTVDYTIR